MPVWATPAARPPTTATARNGTSAPATIGRIRSATNASGSGEALAAKKRRVSITTPSTTPGPMRRRERTAPRREKATATSGLRVKPWPSFRASRRRRGVGFSVRASLTVDSAQLCRRPDPWATCAPSWCPLPVGHRVVEISAPSASPGGEAGERVRHRCPDLGDDAVHEGRNGESDHRHQQEGDEDLGGQTDEECVQLGDHPVGEPERKLDEEESRHGGESEFHCCQHHPPEQRNGEIGETGVEGGNAVEGNRLDAPAQSDDQQLIATESEKQCSGGEPEDASEHRVLLAGHRVEDTRHGQAGREVEHSTGDLEDVEEDTGEEPEG